MKKLLLFIGIAGTSLPSHGQSFQILGVSDTDVTADTVYVWGDTTLGDIEFRPHIKNTSSYDLDMQMKVVPNILVSSPSAYTYCLGLCTTLHSNVGESETGAVVIHIKSDSTYAGTVVSWLTNYQLGTSSLTYIFFNKNNPTDSSFVTVIYNNTPYGINEGTLKDNSLGSIFPNPSGSFASLNYNLDDYSQKAKVIFYDMIGNSIKEYELLANTQGKININTGDMPNGVYFYALLSSNKTIATKKLIISH